MVVAELKKSLDVMPDDLEVVIASPDFLPFSRKVRKVGAIETADDGQTVFVVLGGALGATLPIGDTNQGGR